MRVGGGRTLVVLPVTIVVLLAGIVSAPTAEPDGSVRFVPRWDEPDPDDRFEALHGPGVDLRLDLVPYVDLEDAVLEIRVPPGVEARPAVAETEGTDVRSRIEPDGATVWTVSIGAMTDSVPHGLRLRCRLAGERGRIVTFTVVGATPDGTTMRDAFGTPVGRPGAAPVRRHGANEFLAVPVPADEAPGKAAR